MVSQRGMSLSQHIKLLILSCLDRGPTFWRGHKNTSKIKEIICRFRHYQTVYRCGRHSGHSHRRCAYACKYSSSLCTGPLVTIRLAPLLPTTVAVVQFPDVRKATEAVTEVMNQGVGIRMSTIASSILISCSRQSSNRVCGARG